MAQWLDEIGIETFLPLYKKLRIWKDRRKWVEVPLINSYLFVKISNDKEYMEVVRTDGVVSFVRFEGKAAPVRDEQLQAIRLLLASESELEVTSQKFDEGDEIEVKAGPLQGLHGTLVTFKNKNKVRVEIEHTGQSILVDIDKKYLDKKNRL